MSLEEYKKKVKENLINQFGKEQAQSIMKNYEKDFPQIYKENWSVEGITPAIAMNLY